MGLTIASSSGHVSSGLGELHHFHGRRCRNGGNAGGELTSRPLFRTLAITMTKTDTLPTAGEAAPDFDLEADDGTRVSLSSLKGRNVVLFFYPKDNTSGCTREACGFRDAFPQFGEMNAEIFGVSPDSVKSHQRFRAKYDLPYRLLVDEGHALADEYGVWKEKKNYGLTYMGIERTTVVIDKQGRIARIFPKVKVDGHVEEVAAFVKGLA